MKTEAAGGAIRFSFALGGCAVALVALSLVARHAQWTDDFNLFVPTVFAQSLVYAFSAWLLLQEWPATVDGRVLLATIVAVAVVLRVISLATPPNWVKKKKLGIVSCAGCLFQLSPFVFLSFPARRWLR